MAFGYVTGRIINMTVAKSQLETYHEKLLMSNYMILLAISFDLVWCTLFRKYDIHTLCTANEMLCDISTDGYYQGSTEIYWSYGFLQQTKRIPTEIF